ncbi:MAG: hypothetical protein MK078_11210 [Crocinitomicaceae bacterium]|nr:hypothetical protein [Crocinitomicaceae bacterium]
MSEENKDQGKKRDGVYIIIILLLILGGGYMIYLLSEKNKSLNDCSNNRADLELQLEELNLMMEDEGVAMGENVKENLENMLSMYNNMEASNADMQDSIAAQKEKISNLLVELEDAKGDKRHYVSKVYELQKEAETLRNIMKDYLRTIDSLNTVNQGLVVDLEEATNNLNNVTTERDELQNTTNELTDKVNKGSKLVASSIVSEGIKEKSSGSYKETTKARSCTHIRACFRVGSNAIANKGNKTIYLRVIGPNGSVLTSSTSNTFKADNGTNMLYSDKKSINYQNEAVDVCIFYELGTEIEKGNYKTQLYCEGALMGSDDFVLK